jgi:hypothetical protein
MGTIKLHTRFCVYFMEVYVNISNSINTHGLVNVNFFHRHRNQVSPWRDVRYEGIVCPAQLWLHDSGELPHCVPLVLQRST